MHSPVHGDKEIRFHGIDGLCDLEHSYEPDTSILQKQHAVNALHEIIQAEDDVNLMCLGPLTNLALLVKLYPEDSKRLSSLWVMGGNRHGVGNITRAAEYNFYCDPEAAFAVFQSTKCQIYLLPLETARRMYIPLDFRMKNIAAVDNGITRFLNPIEAKAFKDYSNWVPYDAVAAACFIDSTIMTAVEDWHLTIELGGFFTRGQVILDHNNLQGEKNVRIIEDVDVAKFQEIVLATVTNAD